MGGEEWNIRQSDTWEIVHESGEFLRGNPGAARQKRPRYNTLASTRGLEDAWGRSRRVLIKELRLEGGRRLLRGV